MKAIIFLLFFLIVDSAPLLAEGRSVTPATLSATPVTISANTVLVPVSLSNGVTTVQTTLMLDTGASYTVISKEIATRLKIDLERATPAKFQVIGGGVIQGWRAKVDRVTVGSRSKTAIDVAIIAAAGTLPFEGVLGMNFLRSFQYSIDFEKEVINWIQ